MASILSCYYLDEPLADDELRFAQQVLLGPWAKFRTGADALAQKRVPAVLPLPGADGVYLRDRVQRAEQVRIHLRHAGIRADAGRQVLWVMPCQLEWDPVFRLAIHEETGFAPFVAQRWFDENGATVRGSLRLIDTQMLVRAL